MNLQEYIVPVVSIATYLVFLIVKPLLPDEMKKFIPLFAGVLGIILMTWYSMSFNFSSFLSGLASGLSATGIDQAISLTEGKEKISVYDPKKEGVD